MQQETAISLGLSKFFSDETCQTFANEKCDRVDLLFISRKITGYSTLAVGICLGLEDTAVETLEQDTKYHQKCDRIHKMLMMWQSNNPGNDTWARLIESLVNLSEEDEDRENLKECTREYFCRKRSVRTGMS